VYREVFQRPHRALRRAREILTSLERAEQAPEPAIGVAAFSKGCGEIIASGAQD
jgi:hypothetical protein